MTDRCLPAATTAVLYRSGKGVGGRTDLFLCAVEAESNLMQSVRCVLLRVLSSVCLLSFLHFSCSR